MKKREIEIIKKHYNRNMLKYLNDENQNKEYGERFVAIFDLILELGIVDKILK